MFKGRERVNTNHKDEKPTHAIYWEALGKSHPDEICQRTEALYDENRGGYVLPILNQRILILPEEQKILCRRGEAFEEEHFRDNFYLMVLLYLLNAKGGQPGSNWISEKELKGGTLSSGDPMPCRWKKFGGLLATMRKGLSQAGIRLGGVEMRVRRQGLRLDGVSQSASGLCALERRSGISSPGDGSF